jgi:formylglycine-generating enzyme required for sulfatase activity
MGRVQAKLVQVFLFLTVFSLESVGLSLSHSQEKVFRNSLGMEFVLVPAGGFEMGSPPDEPLRNAGEILHRAILTRPFYMQSSEVTVGQWTRVMGRRLLGPRSGPSDSPITRVSWFDCAEFIKKLNEKGEGTYRLPTEAEWEYACRAGSTSAFPWGQEIDCSRAMFGNSTRKNGECTAISETKGMQVDAPARVKSYSPNPWGLFDMHGNVWEWCQDWFGDYRRGQVTDPTGPGSGNLRVRRGGSWLSEGYRLRCANRAYAHPASRFWNTGLRLVMEVR